LTCANAQMLDLGLEHGAQHVGLPEDSSLPALCRSRAVSLYSWHAPGSMLVRNIAPLGRDGFNAWAFAPHRRRFRRPLCTRTTCLCAPTCRAPTSLWFLEHGPARGLSAVELAHAPPRTCVRRSSLPHGPADGEPPSHTVKAERPSGTCSTPSPGHCPVLAYCGPGAGGALGRTQVHPGPGRRS
jgi:hypothetical protein